MLQGGSVAGLGARGLASALGVSELGPEWCVELADVMKGKRIQFWLVELAQNCARSDAPGLRA